MSVEPELRDALLAAVPALRAYAISLLRDRTRADDLVQETLVRAWANLHRFERGTNLNAWLFTILHNHVRTEYRKNRRTVDDPDGSYASRLSIAPDQQAHLDVIDLHAALARLPFDQREAIILVGAQGLPYEEAARICGVPEGTIKSRVSRGRARLAALLGVETTEDLGADRLTKAAVAAA